MRRSRGYFELILFANALMLAACATSDDHDPTKSTDTGSILASNQSWTMIEPEGDTKCSDGSPYRFYTKPGLEDKVFVFLNGGGACWSSSTCNLEAERPTYVPRADLAHNHPDSHDGVFDLDHPANPVRNWTMVFAPYCTGDAHLGNVVRTYKKNSGTDFTIHHSGATNISAVLDYVEEHTSPERLVIAGGSAGAIASPVYAGKAAALFPDAEVVQFAGGAGGYDSDQIPSILAQWAAFDELDPVKYLDLDRTKAGFYSFYPVEYSASNTIRFSLYDTTADQVQTMFRRLTGETGSLAEAIRRNYIELEHKGVPIAHYLAPGETHTVLRFEAFYTMRVGDVSFSDWFDRLIHGQNTASVDCIAPSAGCE